MNKVKLFEEFISSSLNEAVTVATKDWDRMINLSLKGDDGESVAKVIKDKNKAMARFVAGLKLSNQPIRYNEKYGWYERYFTSLGEKALKLGATPEEIQELYDRTEVPQEFIDKMNKLKGKNLDDRFIGSIVKTILAAGFDVNFIKHSGRAITDSGKDAMSRNGRKWTIGYKMEISDGANIWIFNVDAITDEGDGPTYFISDYSSDSAFDQLKYKSFGRNEFTAIIKNVLAELKINNK